MRGTSWPKGSSKTCSSFKGTRYKLPVCICIFVFVQMLVHHEKELDHLKRMMERKEEEMAKNQVIAARQVIWSFPSHKSNPWSGTNLTSKPARLRREGHCPRGSERRWRPGRWCTGRAWGSRWPTYRKSSPRWRRRTDSRSSRRPRRKGRSQHVSIPGRCTVANKLNWPKN